MSHIIWKGAISFGLVHVPVALYPASQEIGIDFDWLDKRTMDPVGYKRINKRTGKEIDSSDIVKGIKQADGDYVVLSEDEIKAAYPKSTQTIAIEAFVKASEISFVYLERPYYTAPIGKGDRVYALLREAMRESGVIGIARVVLHTKEYLAALIPDGAALVLNTIRWASEVRPVADIDLPAAGKSAAKLKEGELKMARQLIGDMTTAWKPDAFADEFTSAIHKLAARRVEAGKTEKVTELEDEPATEAAGNVVDLTALLRKSLASRKPAKKSAAGSRSSATKTARKTAGKTAKGPTPRRRAA
ncbi:MAG TPA: Ku protein [Caldimonas sp.]|nr:Ku protein [Caldimonas sp.]